MVAKLKGLGRNIVNHETLKKILEDPVPLDKKKELGELKDGVA